MTRKSSSAGHSSASGPRAGAIFTILRAAWFAQNFSEGTLLGPVLGGEIAFPAGDVAEPFLDVDDIADVAVAALTDPRRTPGRPTSCRARASSRSPRRRRRLRKPRGDRSGTCRSRRRPMPPSSRRGSRPITRHSSAIIAVLADLGMDARRDLSPFVRGAVEALLLDELDPAVERHPCHHLAEGEVAGLATAPQIPRSFSVQVRERWSSRALCRAQPSLLHATPPRCAW